MSGAFAACAGKPLYHDPAYVTFYVCGLVHRRQKRAGGARHYPDGAGMIGSTLFFSYAIGSWSTALSPIMPTWCAI